MRLTGQDSILAAKQVAQLTSAGCRCMSLHAGGCLLYQIDVPYCYMFLDWQISFHRKHNGPILLDIAFKEHPAFNPLAEDGQLLTQLLDTWNLRQEQQLYQVLEQVFLRHALSSTGGLRSNNDNLYAREVAMAKSNHSSATCSRVDMHAWPRLERLDTIECRTETHWYLCWTAELFHQPIPLSAYLA